MVYIDVVRSGGGGGGGGRKEGKQTINMKVS